MSKPGVAWIDQVEVGALPVRAISRFEDKPRASMVCSWSSAWWSIRPPTSGVHSVTP
jgi:hypothetical protein